MKFLILVCLTSLAFASGTKDDDSQKAMNENMKQAYEKMSQSMTPEQIEEAKKKALEVLNNPENQKKIQEALENMSDEDKEKLKKSMLNF